MTDQNQLPTLWFTGFMPNGLKASVTLPIATDDGHIFFNTALKFTNELLAAGFLLNEPGLEPGEERELIVTVMRRAKPSDDTPIVDFYTDWRPGGDEPWGTYKYLHMYLGADKADVLAALMEVSGLTSLEQIPLYDGQSPLKRTFGKVHPKELRVPTPFYVVKRQGEEKVGSDGKPFRPWEFVRFEAANGAPASAPQQPTGDPQPQFGQQQGQPERKWTADDWQRVRAAVYAQAGNPKHGENIIKKMFDEKRVNATMDVDEAITLILNRHAEDVPF